MLAITRFQRSVWRYKFRWGAIFFWSETFSVTWFSSMRGLTRTQPPRYSRSESIFRAYSVTHITYKFCSRSMSRGSSVVIATSYGLDGPGFESQWGARFSALVQTGHGAHPASKTMGTVSLPGVMRPGCGVDHPHHLAPRLKKRSAIPLLPLWDFVTCSMVKFTFTFTFCSRMTKGLDR